MSGNVQIIPYGKACPIARPVAITVSQAGIGAPEIELMIPDEFLYRRTLVGFTHIRLDAVGVEVLARRLANSIGRDIT